ncbi:hypothetical protein NRIC_35400 [Enterococcus florum]|uniref:PTS EIIB type-4 domain-containing protein n=1 Tax=Enterococcus florum TaxID=2480627 RepID=A0A4V0WQ02_9ENTE|nr:PTS sugar transporter subunit IIB [Enterococcus florum]GCF95649.1 hypothetical protein NRIC_35400 [Enterococcus florum]
MGIIYNRVDGRMVHGQVATSLAPALRADEILVLNDEAAQDTNQIMLMQLASPQGCEIDVFTIETGTEIILDQDFNGDRTFIIFKTIQDALKAAVYGYVPEVLYIGGMYSTEGKEEKAIALYVDSEDCRAFRQLEDKGVQLIYQVSPLNKEKKLSELVDY